MTNLSLPGTVTDPKLQAASCSARVLFLSFSARVLDHHPISATLNGMISAYFQLVKFADQAEGSTDYRSRAAEGFDLMATALRKEIAS